MAEQNKEFSLNNLTIIPDNYRLLIMEDEESLRKLYESYLDFFEYQGESIIVENVASAKEKLDKGFVPQMVLSDVLEGSYPNSRDYTSPLTKLLRNKLQKPFSLMHTTGSYDSKKIDLKALGSLGILKKGIGGFPLFRYALAILASSYNLMISDEQKPKNISRWHQLTDKSLSEEITFFDENFKHVLQKERIQINPSLEERAKRKVENLGVPSRAYLTP